MCWNSPFKGWRRRLDTENVGVLYNFLGAPVDARSIILTTAFRGHPRFGVVGPRADVGNLYITIRTDRELLKIVATDSHGINRAVHCIIHSHDMFD